MSILNPTKKKKPTESYLDRVNSRAASVTPTPTTPKPSSVTDNNTSVGSVSSVTKPGESFLRQNVSTINQGKSTALGTNASAPVLSIPSFQPIEGNKNSGSYTMRRLNEINRMGEIETQGAMDRLQRRQQAEQAAMQSSGNNPFDKYGIEGDWMGGGDLSSLGLNDDQIRNARQIIDIGRQRGLGGYEIQTALMTALAESNLINVNYGDRDSLGLFQQRPSQGWGTPEQVSNPVYSIGKFYDTLAKTSRGKNMWNTAQNVQRSAFADGSNYRAKAGLANRIWTAYNAPGTTSTKANIAGWVNANVWKYHDFDGAYGSQCVDLFRYYHRDVVGDAQIGSVGSAKNIWTNAGMNRAYYRVNASGRAQQGDVVVFDGSWGSGHGHVGIVLSDKGGKLTIINSNSSTVGNGKPTNIVTVPKRGLLGYFRPKKFA